MRHTCEQVIEKILEARLDALDSLTGGAARDMSGELNDYALCVEYIPPGTFEDQEEGYLRYQMMWGAVCDEFRFFLSQGLTCRRIEYWFADGLDRAHRVCTGNATVQRLWLWLSNTGAVATAMPPVARH